MQQPATYYSYWGKAAGENGQSMFHLLPFHCLDVGAVGDRLLLVHEPLRKHLANLVGMETTAFHQWAVFLLVLHDIGKFAVTFQALRPDVLKSLQKRDTGKLSQRHDTLGYLLWQEKVKPHLQKVGSLPAGVPRRSAIPEIRSADIWMAAMTGHHGTPPKPTGGLLLADPFEPTDQEAALDFVDDVMRLLLPENSQFPHVDPDTMCRGSWWLAGFAVLCDWIGSNRNYFPYRDQPRSLGQYWVRACQQADAAIADTGLLPKTVTRSLQLDQLICGSNSVASTPLQKLATKIELMPGPQLFILEDVTGAGKTEAALLLAQRLMADKHAHGLYLGLPTMATANAMYTRLGQSGYRQLYQADQQPSLVLAHGAAHLLDDFRHSLVSGEIKSDGGYEGLPAAAAHCNQWLADNRKKALLADMGIGTLDQALLAILPSRHQSLRLLGLIGKVLVIDEVHACDSYMHTLLCRLLRTHAQAGGSAILLSATLPQSQRQALVNAFAQGLDGSVQGLDGSVQGLTAFDYPLLTQIGDSALQEIAVPTRESVRREVNVTSLESEKAVEEVINEAYRNGQCLCWIRNSVADAREAYVRLREHYPDRDIDLFHARFALADRLDIEQRVLKNFGKHSTHENRKGRLLIATQVVEQSLDLDFDQLITDLAPIDLIIQRAGRLRRHRRDAQGNPFDGDDQRGVPQLHLHAPVWQELPGDDWYASTFRRGARVYPDHGQLWMGLKLLRERGGFRMPEDARSLVEGVYGDDVVPPEGLQACTFDAQGDARARQSVAMLNELKIELGYSDGATNRWWEDTLTPTRLGDPTTTVWLARWEGGQLRPWREGLPHAWQQSSLSLHADRIKKPVATSEISQEAIDACLEELPAGCKWGVLLPLVEDDAGWIGIAENGDGTRMHFFYSSVYGLITEKELNAMEVDAE